MEVINSSRSIEEESDTDLNRNSVALLKSTVPRVAELFHVHKKIGEGTFSSVFLATLKSSDKTKKFALKHVIPTYNPDKFENELWCLQHIGGQDYVIGLELCLRGLGCVVFVMPYMRHDKFSEYVQDMTVEETKHYVRALLTALRRVHKFNIIHRDVKPSNFLYDRYNRRYQLVDFGLAQRHANTNSGIGVQDNKVGQSVKRKRHDENMLSVSSKVDKKSGETKCFCFGKSKVCSICLTRPSQSAPREGTPGFRAPEVLLKHPMQTPAIDIWASGVMMLCILCGTQPFFRSPDDCTALAEITTIFGSSRMQQCAKKLGKKIIFHDNIPGIDITLLCQKLQKRNKSVAHDKDVRIYKETLDTQFPKEAYHLLTRLLDLDSDTRITAEEALNHPFLRI